MSISVNTGPSGSLHGWLKRRPDSEDDGKEEGRGAKAPRYSWYVTLESESPQPTDEDDESVYSVQDKETDYVADTSDTSTNTWLSSSDAGDLSLHVEYEVASLSEGPNPFDNDESSSGVSDIVTMGVLTFCDSDLGLADNSNDSRSSVDSEIGTADYWTCVQCNTKNNNPLFRYCEKCYQIRKNFFPPRPKWRKRKRHIESEGGSSQISDRHPKQELTSADSGLGSSQDSKCSLTLDINLDAITMPGNETAGSLMPENTTDTVDGKCSESTPALKTNLKEKNDDRTHCDQVDVCAGYLNTSSGVGPNTDGLPSSQDDAPSTGTAASDGDTSFITNETLKHRDKLREAVDTTRVESDSKLCITCTAAPKNGAFVHGAVTHICCCYRCAVKVWSKTKRCPICNRRVTNVLKAFYT
ncbi:E3 ubiquitin-protein ligase Mdm2-like [Athalia rosae]|uniref:E3 ubiquitin-protein ligase Mdm2-like n=1 Tax=Athalia rosae TaxID=37344 RepID=UPI000626C8F2|nr:E3 ubiquitin-protein ligase Mdm2-like [Athalia rosae]